MRTPYIKPRISGKQIVRLLLAGLFTVVCSIIILPRIESASWYPAQIGTFNLVPGMDFTRHIEMAIDLSGQNDYPEKLESAETLQKRLSFFNYRQSTMILDNEILTISVPQDYPAETVTQIAGTGVVTFLKPKAGVDFETNALAMFDESNFEASDIQQSDILSAELTTESEGYAYIELSVSEDTRQKWSDTSGTIGLSVDGIFVQGWLVPPNDTAPQPTVIVQSSGNLGARIAGYLETGPISPDIIDTPAENAENIYTADAMDMLFTVLAGTFGVGLLIRRILIAESISQTIITGLLIIGMVAAFKLTGVPLSVSIIIALIVHISVFCSVPASLHIPALIAVLVFSIFLRLSSYASAKTLGQAGTILAVSGLLGVFFYQFFNIHEEE